MDLASMRWRGPAELADGTSRLFEEPGWRFLGVYSGRINDQSDLGLVWNLTAITDILQSGVPGTDLIPGPVVPPRLAVENTHSHTQTTPARGQAALTVCAPLLALD